MPDIILNEFCVKSLYYAKYKPDYLIKIARVYKNIDIPISTQLSKYIDINDSTIKYVCKVDEMVKGRFKNGLILLNATPIEIINWIPTISNYNRFYIEQMHVSDNKIEHYLLFRNCYDGIELVWCKNGGVNVGDVSSHSKQIIVNSALPELTDNDVFKLTDSLSPKLINSIKSIYSFYKHYNFTYLEVNPLSLIDDYLPLDFAAKFDDTALYKYIYDQNIFNMLQENIVFSAGNDIDITPEELAIKQLDKSTGSSLKFNLLNRNGNIWTLIAGGGASVVYTDAIINNGYKKYLANYGEYSGNPNTADVYEYCKNIFKLIETANSPYSDIFYLIIGGGIANFTLIDKTFDGIIKAIHEFNHVFSKFRVLVRRGGPNHIQGLANLKRVFNQYNVSCEVYGSDTPITSIVSDITGLDKEFVGNPELSLTANIPYTNPGVFNINPDSRCFINGYQLDVVQRMLDFDYVCNNIVEKTHKPPSVCAIIDSHKFPE